MIDYLVNMVDKVKKYGLSVVFGRYYSVYRAKVTDNKDPLKMGRVKVIIPTLFGETELPDWVLPRDFRGTGKQYGEFFVPRVDDWCCIEFLEGDTRYPMYSGGWVGETEIAEEFLHSPESEPLVRGYKSKDGLGIFFDETPDEQKTILKSNTHTMVMDDTKEKEAVYFFHKLGTQWQIDKDGSFKLVTKSGHYISFVEPDGTILIGTKDGAIVALKDNITISDSSGGSVVNISKDGVQVTAKAKLVIQSNSAALDTGALSISAGSMKAEYKQTCEIKGLTTEKIEMGQGKIAIGNAGVELVDIVTQALQALMTTTAPGYGAPISSVATFAQLFAKLSLLKK